MNRKVLLKLFLTLGSKVDAYRVRCHRFLLKPYELRTKGTGMSIILFTKVMKTA